MSLVNIPLVFLGNSTLMIGVFVVIIMVFILTINVIVDSLKES